MKYVTVGRLASMIIGVMLVAATTRAGAPPVVGERLVEITLAAPAAADHRAYLGLSESTTFDPLDISGRLLIIEIFSMYCPYCQREAPAVNRLHQAIENAPELRGKVKLLGIGVGNSEFEVDHFRKHYQIGFPLFPDEAFAIHQSLGEVRTPFFIFVDLDAAAKGTILWTGAGTLEPLESILGRLKGFLNEP